MKHIQDLAYMPYNRANRDRARDQRKIQTSAEEIAREILRKKRFGYLFLRQKLIDSFILDFYCSKLLLGVEIDGGIHKKTVQYDTERDMQLYKKGIKVIRYENEFLYDDIKGRESDIKKEIKIREKELSLI